jgi:cytochrome c biogenesis protein
MTETTGTTTYSQPTDDLDGALAVPLSDVGDRVWRFFISMRTGLALILGLAALSVVGALVAQAPSGLQSDPAAYAAWVESVRPKYGGWTGVFDALGFFSIFNSVWFRGITVLLVTSLLACSVNRAPYLWKQATHPRTRMGSAFFEHAPLALTTTTEASPQAAAEAVAAALRSRRFRIRLDADGDVVNVYADKNRWGPFGTVVAHLSLVAILIGAVVGATFGFRNESLAVPVGTTADVGNGTGLAVKASRFVDSYYANGSPSDYASDLVVYRAGQQVAASTVRVNEPLTVDGTTFYQSYFGPAAAIRIVGTDGTVLFDRGVPLQYSFGDERQVGGQIELPAAGLTAYVIAPASGEVDPSIRAGQVKLEVYQTDSSSAPLAVEVLSQGQSTKVAGLDVTFEREHQFTGLIVASDPGAPFIWLGCFLLVAGTAVVFFFPTRRVWAQARAGDAATTVRLGAIVRHDVGFGADFQRLSAEIRETLNGPATDERKGTA